MSITLEIANMHADCAAVSCCRFEAGSVIEPANLEEPDILPDLEASGLLYIPENCLKIGEVLGAKLKSTVDALTPLTPDVVEGYKRSEEVSEPEEREEAAVAGTAQAAPAVQVQTQSNVNGGMVRIHIGEGKDINLEFPLSISTGTAGMVSSQSVEGTSTAASEVAGEKEAAKAERFIRGLVRKHFEIDSVELGAETKIEGTKLFIRENILSDAIASQDLVVDMKLDIITPDKYKEYSETIMDIQPIATKEEGELGEGITRVLDGVIMMVTGTDENGVQIGEFGSSEGIIDQNIMWGRPGSPEKGEILIKTQVTVKAGTNMERPGPMAAHEATDIITQEIREALKKSDESLVVNTDEFKQVRRPGKKKVVIVKEIMGQGAMHDNFILPVEPAGTLGAKPNVDLGNVPLVVSPLQVLDGCIHALTCIGPASKETTRHYWREPLVLEVMNDEELDLAAVVFVGSPQVNAEKFYVSKLLGMTVEAMDVDGAIVTTEGFGNNHVDFASHVEQIGKRGIPVVAMTYSAVQGQLVVGNPYMDCLVDNNKSAQGIENEILENNCLAPEDAIRAVCMLKAKIAGEKIKEAERKWNPNVKLNNIELIEKTLGRKIELELNEQSLEKSKKRREIYEKED